MLAASEQVPMFLPKTILQHPILKHRGFRLPGPIVLSVSGFLLLPLFSCLSFIVFSLQLLVQVIQHLLEVLLAGFYKAIPVWCRARLLSFLCCPLLVGPPHGLSAALLPQKRFQLIDSKFLAFQPPYSTLLFGYVAIQPPHSTLLCCLWLSSHHTQPYCFFCGYPATTLNPTVCVSSNLWLSSHHQYFSCMIENMMVYFISIANYTDTDCYYLFFEYTYFQPPPGAFLQHLSRMPCLWM